MSQTISFSHSWGKSYFPTGGAEKIYLLFEARGAEASQAKERAPINLSLVFDRSGSMSESIEAGSIHRRRGHRSGLSTRR